jgi:hypothetical protein
MPFDAFLQAPVNCSCPVVNYEHVHALFKTELSSLTPPGACRDVVLLWYVPSGPELYTELLL